MKVPAVLFFCSLLAASSAAQQRVSREMNGYVTRTASPSDFDVNGIRVKCSDKTKTRELNRHVRHMGCPLDPIFLGEHIKVEGDRSQSAYSIGAERIEEIPIPLEDFSGSSVIDGPPDASSLASGVLVIRADGYQIRLDANTKLTIESPLHELRDVKAGNWIDYKGKRNADGSITASMATLWQDKVGDLVLHLREKFDYDPSSVSIDDKQSGLSKAVKGIDPKRFPAYQDPVMQARVSSIGEKLVPAYQRNLPDSDPTKIHFRFQLVDTKIWNDALALPSGVILISPPVVEHMQNDSQLAAVLAENIAWILEIDNRDIVTNRALVATSIASEVAGIFVPGVGFGDIGAGITAKVLQIKAQEQSGRVALGLLHDAGFEIEQAPIAWWLLSVEKGDQVAEIDLPERAIYLYRLLGENWRNPAIASSKP